MLKHVYHSGSSLRSQSQRGVSPSPSATSVSTDSSSASIASSSPRSVYSVSSTGSGPDDSPASTISPTSFSWRRLSECRTSSRLSMSENPNAVPLRAYAGELRPDIQYKTVGVTHSTTCEEVIGALLAKCKVRFKDPRLFQLTMEVDIRGPNGCDTRASIQLDDTATPLQLQECYPKGQARFCLKMKRGSLVKVFDGSNTAGWLYKSIMISECTTAGELVDILFLNAVKSLLDAKYYTLHVEVDAWKRQLEWDEAVIPAHNIANQWGTPKLILGCHVTHLPTSFLLGNSTTSLYDNVQSRLHSRNASLTSSEVSTSSAISSPESIRRDWRRGRWRRSKSLSESPTEVRLTFREPSDIQFASSSSALVSRNRKPCQLSIGESLAAGFARLNTRAGKYELSEAFFV